MTTADPPTRADLRFTLAACAVASVPFVVAAVALHHKPWFPTSDLAQAELRMRGFWSDPPLLGAAGRIGTINEQGHHPGPLMFWLAWPVYALLGRTAWAYETSVLALNVGWTFVIGLVVRRRGGRMLVGAVLLGLTVVVRSYHADALSQPWNPYVALLPWFAFVLLVWGLLCDDLVLLPVAVLVGSYCVQCHVGYAAEVGGLLAGSLVWQAVRLWRQGRPAAPDLHGAVVPAGGLGGPLRLLGVAVAGGVVVWIPPVIEQLRHHPGNFTILYRYFTHPPEPPVGLRGGLHIVLVQLSPIGNWITGSWATTGSTVLPGLALLVVWAAVSALAWRAGRLPHRLLRLDAVLAGSVVLAVASSARIFGDVWGYLVEWMWALTALLVLASLWAAFELVLHRLPERRPTAPAFLVPAVGVVAVSALFAAQAAAVEPLAYLFSRQEAVLSHDTASHLDRNGRYVVVWEDPIGLGGTGFGLVLQLSRQGYHAGVLPQYRAGAPGRYLFGPGEYDHVLHVVTGINILTWRAEPEASEVACVDLRTPADRSESRVLEARLTAALVARHLDDLVSQLHANLFALTLDPRLPADLRADATRLVDHAEAVAVFVTSAEQLAPSAVAAAAHERALADGTFGSAPTCR